MWETIGEIVAFSELNGGRLHQRLAVKCLCDCGKIAMVRCDALGVTQTSMCRACSGKLNGATNKAAGRPPRHGHCVGGEETRTYNSWANMRDRCYTPNTDGFANYGGRGIEVCSRWRDSFDNFLADMGERPPRTTLDRRDSNGNYEPNNCRWASPKDQGRNRRNNTSLTICGETRLIVEWAERSGLSTALIRKRVRDGWPEEEWLRQATWKRVFPVGELHTHDGKTMTIKEWGDHLGVQPNTLYQRLELGLPPEQVFQSKSLRNVTTLKHGGETLLLSEWSKRTGIGLELLRKRMKRGWSSERILDARDNRRTAIT